MAKNADSDRISVFIPQTFPIPLPLNLNEIFPNDSSFKFTGRGKVNRVGDGSLMNS